MNRKGFSIPELLAVIVIIGILITIASASYNGISNSLKDRTYNNKLNLIKTKAIEYATDYGIDATTISVAKLISEGYLEEENDTETNEKLNNPLGGYLDCYQVNINRELDDYDVSVSSSDNCSLAEADILASNISITAYEASNDTLNDDNKLGTNKDIKWSKNDVYLFVEPNSLGEFAKEEMTITWSVNGDNKEKSGHMAASANIDTTYANIYKIETSYLFDNIVTVKIPTSKGLLSKSVNVKIDKEVPTLTLDTNASYESSSKVITFNGSDGSGSGFGKYAYALEEAETNNPTFNIESTNNTWTVTENKTYYAYAIDAVGNVSKVVPISVTGIDNSKPVCKNPVNNSNWTNNSYTYNYGCKNDAGSGCATPDKEETTTTEGEFKKVNWTVKDNIGNTRDCSYNVATRVDKTAPTCEITIDNSSKKGNNNWYIGNVKLLLSTKDNLSGVSEYGITTSPNPEYNGSKTATLTNDTDSNGITYYGYVKDRAGNTGSCKITVKRLTQTPSCTLASSGTVGNNGWYRSNVNIKMTSNSSYVTNKNVNNTNNDNYTLTSDTKGTTIKGTVTNEAGLTGNCSISVKKDTEAPSCNVNASGTMGQNNWYISNVSMSLSATDSTSGVASYGLNANSKSYNSRNSQSLTWDTSGITYYGIVSDNAGNQRDCSKWVKRLATVPSCSVNVSGTKGWNDWYTSDINASVSSSSAYVSSKRITNNNSSNYRINWDTNGATITGEVVNAAGLKGSCSRFVKRLTQTPSCSVNVSGTKGWNDWYTSNVYASINSPSAHISSKVITNNNFSNYTLTSDTNGTTISGRVTNEAGISGTCSSWVKKDTTRPSCSWSGESTSWTNSNRSVNVSCSDYGSGCNTGTKTWTYSSGTVKTASLSNDIYDNAGNKTTCSKAASVYVDKEGPSSIYVDSAEGINFSLDFKSKVKIENKSDNKVNIIFSGMPTNAILSGVTPVVLANISVKGNDTNGSGVSYYEVTGKGIGTKKYTCAGGDNSCEFTGIEKNDFYVTAIDNVGNRSKEYQFSIRCAVYVIGFKPGSVKCW